MRAWGLSLRGEKVQPTSRANRRTSKTRFRSVTAGWMCSVVLMCMMLRSVVESEANINQWFTFVNNHQLIF